jgi:hypothetical protein
MNLLPQFPEFEELTSGDCSKWCDLVENFPPYSEFSFPNLMTWWSSLGNCKVSQLNENLVISYWLPGDDDNSGLSIVGTHKIDETICLIFDWQKAHEKAPRLVLVPEFVMNRMRFPEIFRCLAQRDYDESIIAVKDFASLEAMQGFKRAKAKRFQADHNENTVELRSLDLSLDENRNMLLELHKEWQDRAIINVFLQHKQECFITTMKNAGLLGVENICLFVNGELHGFFLYHTLGDPKYATCSFMGFSFEKAGIFEYALHEFAKFLASEKVEFLNIDSDMGDSIYRTIHLSLSPVDFFRKYIIEPRGPRR